MLKMFVARSSARAVPEYKEIKVFQQNSR